ncbi:DUF1835 domain-containing protein [Gynurincola endophyticus]|jgi:hypothetical protein|uniref:DUF1835 domain-containing protein n=1 Tax=Gynurincola endophyticus TaxID=2479004 RepID=UPI000F8C61D5|nr:DUF1835 domain-containing protein [Gynurincola endophyticus]
MIHIVFNEPDVPVLQAAQALDESIQGDIVVVKDDYAVGPLSQLYIGEGITARKEWWKEVVAGTDIENAEEWSDYQTMANVVGRLRRDENEVVWIWAAQNHHDVSGYFFTLHYMKEFQGRVFILYLNNLPFINEKGLIFYPDWLSQIPPKEFLKAKKLNRPITMSEFEIDPDEWIKICSEEKYIRILEGGKKLAQYDVDYYDEELIKFITKDYQKANRIIQQVFNKTKVKTGDIFLLWRLKEMVRSGKLEAQGELKNFKDFDVRLNTGNRPTEETPA